MPNFKFVELTIPTGWDPAANSVVYVTPPWGVLRMFFVRSCICWVRVYGLEDYRVERGWGCHSLAGR